MVITDSWNKLYQYILSGTVHLVHGQIVHNVNMGPTILLNWCSKTKYVIWLAKSRDI